MAIRRAAIADLPVIVSLEEYFGEDGWTLEDHVEWASMGYDHFISYPYEEGPVFGAFLIGRPRAGTGVEIASVSVFPQYRGRGHARAMMRHVKHLYPRERLWLNVRVDNVGAIRLYESEGFKKCGTEPKLYKDGCDAYVMEFLPQS